MAAEKKGAQSAGTIKTHGHQLLRLQMRRLQPQMDLEREFFRRVLQRKDFLRENFGALVAGVHLANHQHGLVGLQ